MRQQLKRKRPTTRELIFRIFFLFLQNYSKNNYLFVHVEWIFFLVLVFRAIFTGYTSPDDVSHKSDSNDRSNKCIYTHIFGLSSSEKKGCSAAYIVVIHVCPKNDGDDDDALSRRALPNLARGTIVVHSMRKIFKFFFFFFFCLIFHVHVVVSYNKREIYFLIMITWQFR